MNSAKTFYLKYVDESTGVTTTNNAAEATPFVCREVKAAAKGLYIVGGKKVIVK